jgi:phosphoribosylaminoimidazolecarboxamide formyltransferase/IMP cyclohydrolase
LKQVSGGFLLQDKDVKKLTAKDLCIVSKKLPSKNELDDMLFAWNIVKHVKSNAILYVKNFATIGIGAGQMSRLDSTRIATIKASDMTERMNLKKSVVLGSVAASDAFFPFSDGVLELARAGVSSIIQPGGSINDPDIIETVNKAKISMVFTGVRHFSH